MIGTAQIMPYYGSRCSLKACGCIDKCTQVKLKHQRFLLYPLGEGGGQIFVGKAPKKLVLSPKGISGSAEIMSSLGFCTATQEKNDKFYLAASKIHIIVVQ